MPTGAVLGGEHFDAIVGPLSRHRAWVIWDAAMERIRFDGQPPIHPGAHPGLADRTITVGSASKELRMIGWRVGPAKHPGDCPPAPRPPPPRWMAGGPAAAGTYAWSSPTSPPNGSPTCALASTPP
jgi:Aminotransferase class I and II